MLDEIGIRKRVKAVDRLKEMTDKNHSFLMRKQQIEEKIEYDIAFYDNENTSGANQFMKLRKLLKQNEKKIKEMKVDPMNRSVKKK